MKLRTYIVGTFFHRVAKNVLESQSKINGDDFYTKVVGYLYKRRLGIEFLRLLLLNLISVEVYCLR